jgi:oxygen-independent coproporphyrinogen-3 oxidase
MCREVPARKCKCMWTYYPELLATPVPRYTSYPTAAEFHDGVGEADQRAGLEAISPTEPISLYVHIPYCREICWYCGCNTGAANRPQRLANYLERLSWEIDLIAGLLNDRGWVVRIAFGGGSPNAIAPRQFLDLVRHLKSAFSIGSSPVISTEIDPRGFDADFAAAMAEAGVTRASLGVQTFDPKVQAAIGRIQSRETIEQAVDLLRASGVTSLNFDLMYGLPQQSDAALIESLKLSHETGADRLAVFGYAHVPHLVPRQRRIDSTTLPGAAGRFRQAALAHDWLVGEGWVTVGFDHFARPHDPLAVAARERRVRRNFQGFTDDNCEILVGLGASAISRFVSCLVQNERNSGRYGMKVGTSRLAAMRGIATPPGEVMRAHLIEHLLCQGTAHLHYLPDRLQVRKDLRPFEERGLISWNHWELCLAREALPYARTIASVLDPWRASSMSQLSIAV